jgi:uncharacterized phiE125 gp8 family phage protein
MEMADLLTAAEIAPFLGTEAVKDDAEFVDTLIGAAQEAIEQITNRNLNTATTYTEYHDAGEGFIYVDRPPIVSILSLYDCAWTKGSNAAREITSTNYVTDSDDQGHNYRQGKVELCNQESSFGGSRLDAKVVYVGGWTKSTLPADLRQAWIELVCYWYNEPERFHTANGAVQIPSGLFAVLRRYSLRRNA